MRLSQTRESLCVRRRCVPSNPLAKLARLPLLHLVLVPMLAKPYPDSYSNVRPPLAIQQNQVKETAPLSTTLFGLALVPSIRRPVAFFLLLPRPRAWTSGKLHALFLSGLWLSAFVFGFLHFLVLFLTLTVPCTFFHSLMLIQQNFNVLSLFYILLCLYHRSFLFFIFSYAFITIFYGT